MTLDGFQVVSKKALISIEIVLKLLCSLIESTTGFPRVQLNIFISDSYVNFSRTYTKLPEFLATVGGFMKLVFTLLNVITSIIRNYLIRNFIIDRVFDNGGEHEFQLLNKQKETIKRKSIIEFIKASKIIICK